MSTLDAAIRYFDAWNARDAAAIRASLTNDGSYCDPITGTPIRGDAINQHVDALWAAFPDLSFEIKSAAEAGDNRVAVEWIMRGTNNGSFRGMPPTGKRVELSGADFIETDGSKVICVTGYFDGGAVPRQLGHQVIVQPETAGPFRFGTSRAVQTGKTDAPGAFSITQLHAPDEEAAERVRDYSRKIMMEMMDAPGFVGAVVAKVGLRLITMSAWKDKDAPARFMKQRTHAEAMKPFFDGTLATSTFTSVWIPERINSYWIRCASCGSMVDPKRAAACTCGAPLPDHPPYW